MKQLFIALCIFAISNNAFSQVILDKLNGSTLGTAIGITYTATPNEQRAVFLQNGENTIQRAFNSTISELSKFKSNTKFENNTLLLAHYPLFESGDDITGNNNTIRLVNTPFQNGGIYCNGIYEYTGGGETNFCTANTSSIKNFNFNSIDVSVDFLVNDVKFQPVLVCGFGCRWLGFYLNSDATVSLYYNNINFLSSTKTYTLNTWHNARITYDGDTAKIYIDNNFACSKAVQLDYAICGDQDATFSPTNYGRGEVLDGYLKDLKISYLIKSTSPPTPTINIINYTLHSEALKGNQWYNQNGKIDGATSQDYSPTENGDYYCIVTVMGSSSNKSNIITVNLSPTTEKTINLTTAGTLSSMLTSQEKSTITKLTVTGNIDARDINCMNNKMTALTDISLKDAIIVAYDGIVNPSVSYFNESRYYPANEMPQYSFSENKRIKSIQFPVSLTSIGREAFAQCAELSGSITLPNSLVSIGSAAFSGCTKITGILTVPASVSLIENATFSRCQITNFIVEAGNKRYSNGADGILYTIQKDTIMLCPGAKSGVLTIPTTVKHIFTSALYGCDGLTGNLIIPNSVTSMGLAAFSMCSNITGLTLPNSITSIENSVFYKCKSLTGTVVIPSSITNIHVGGFYSCDSLENFIVENGNSRFISIDGVIYSHNGDTLKFCPAGRSRLVRISNNIKAITNGAFSSCLKLKNLNVDIANPSSFFLESIYVFNGIKSTCRLIVPKGSLAAYKAAPQWKEFTQIVEANSITVQVGANGSVTENSINVNNGGSVMAIDNQTSTFTIIPSPGYEVATLTYNGANVISQLVNNTFTTPAVVADGTLNVTFKRSIYKISVKLGGKGTMNLSYYYGDTPMFDFTPSSDAKIQSVFFNGVDVTANLVDNIYTMDPITTNGLLEVVFVSTATSTDNAPGQIISICKSNNTIQVQGTIAGQRLSLYTMNGSLVTTTVAEGNSMSIPFAIKGLYMLRIDNKTFKIAL